MFKRGAAPATARSYVASRMPMPRSGEGWAFRRVEGIAREWLPVERGDVLRCGMRRASRDAAEGARKRLPVKRGYMRIGGEVRAPGGAAVGAR